MTDREALKMALEALEASINVPCYGGHPKQEAAAEALRAQLEQPDRQALQAAGVHPAPCARHCEAKAFELEIRGLKSALRAQPGQEPVTNYELDAEFNRGYKEGSRDAYARSPQRNPLTLEELEKIVLTAYGNADWTIVFARAIEAAHGIGETK